MRDAHFYSRSLRSQTKMAKKKTYVILAMIVIIIGGVYYWKIKPEVINYTTETAKIGTIAKTVSVTGEFRPEIQADLSFKFGGQIKSILVSVGDKVEKNQKIATIDRGTLYEELAKTKHEVNVQKKALYDIKKRDETYNKYQEDAQRIRIKQAEESVSIIIAQIRDLILYSPIDGLVIKKSVEVGENILANASVITISNLGEPFIETDVPESDITDVKIGQKADLTFDALPSDEKLEGEVFEIEPASTVIQDVVYYKVKIKLLSQDSRLKLGMSADADINTFEKNNVVMIPYRAVKKDGEQEYVEILKPENMTERVDVETGLKGDDGMVEIISGIKGGEKVIVLSSEK